MSTVFIVKSRFLNVFNLIKVNLKIFVIVLHLLNISNGLAESLTTEINSCHNSPKLSDSNSIIIPPHFSYSRTELEFKLENLTSPLNCTGPRYKVAFMLSTVPTMDTFVLDEEEWTSEILSKNVITFLPSGYLSHTSESMSNSNSSSESLNITSFYHSSEYCLRRLNDTHVEAEFCLSSCTSELSGLPKTNLPLASCVHKCCPPGYVLDFEYSFWQCKESTNISWSHSLYNANSLSKTCLTKVSPFIPFRIQNGYCEYYGELADIRSPTESLTSGFSRFRLLDDGTAVTRRLGDSRDPITLKPIWIRSQRFCIDGIQNFNNESSIFTGNNAHQILFVCQENVEDSLKPTHEEEGNYIKVYVYISALYLSLIPLAFTIVAYWIIWNSQNIHGWTVFSHIASLFLFNAFLGTSHLIAFIDPVRKGEYREECVILGILVHFFFLSTFIWLTNVNFEIWLTFRTLKPSSQASKGIQRYRFLAYFVFAIGGPILVIVIGFLLTEKYDEKGIDSDCDIVLPNYGWSRCYLVKSAEGVYVYFIIGFLLLFNLGFFISTVLVLYKHRKSTRSTLRGRSTKTDTHSSELFIKLFTVMGISFWLEVISWTCQSNWVWVAIDVGNILVRAIVIFVIFAWKKKVTVELKRRVHGSAFMSSVLRRMTTDTMDEPVTLKMSTLRRTTSINTNTHD